MNDFLCLYKLELKLFCLPTTKPNVFVKFTFEKSSVCVFPCALNFKRDPDIFFHLLPRHILIDLFSLHV